MVIKMSYVLSHRIFNIITVQKTLVNKEVREKKILGE